MVCETWTHRPISFLWQDQHNSLANALRLSPNHNQLALFLIILKSHSFVVVVVVLSSGNTNDNNNNKVNATQLKSPLRFRNANCRKYTAIKLQSTSEFEPLIWCQIQIHTLLRHVILVVRRHPIRISCCFYFDIGYKCIQKNKLCE